MPFYEGIGLIAEKNAVVIDIGTAFTKAGYAGEAAPRAVLRTPPILAQRVKSSLGKGHALERDLLYDDLVSFVHNIYFGHLLVNPKDRRVVLVDNLLGPILLKQVLSRVLFRHFEVLSILYAPSPLLPLITLGAPTGMVLDVGHAEATLVPVVEGVPVMRAWQALPLAGEAVEAAVREMLEAKATVKDGQGEVKKVNQIEGLELSRSLVEDVKVRLCFATTLERGEQIQAIRRDASSVSGLSSFLNKSVPAVEYPMPKGDLMLVVDGSTRESACEVLFEQDADRLSVATMVLDALMACAIDTRRALASNLVIIGGTSLTKGFKARLFQELRKLLETEERYKESLSINDLKVHVSPVKANFASWTGASIFGATDAISTRSFTRDVYMKDKSGAVPDWSDFRFNTLFSGEEAAKQG